MNHCLLEVEVLEAPQLRYTQDNQTPIAEMSVRFDGLRIDDPSGQIRVVGWGSLAQDLQNRVEVGQRLLLEGRLRMNTVTRPDGLKEKRAEFTLARLHPLGPQSPEAPGSGMAGGPAPSMGVTPSPAGTSVRRAGPPGRSPAPSSSGPARGPAAAPASPGSQPGSWNSGPLVADPEGFPEEDDIPF